MLFASAASHPSAEVPRVSVSVSIWQNHMFLFCGLMWCASCLSGWWVLLPRAGWTGFLHAGNMLPAGTNEVLRAKTNEGGYKLTTHCHKLLTIEITITVGIAWSRSSLGLAGLSYSACTVDYTNFRSSSSASKLHENEVLPPYICVSRHNPRSSIMLLRPFLTWSHKSLWTRTLLRVKD